MKNSVLAGCLTAMVLVGCSSEEKTNDMYLIPEGYKGHVYAIYNVKGAPALTHEGNYDVHKINSDGYFATSEPDMDYGSVTDKYYYVDKEGHRTKINENCIKTLGTGGMEQHEGTSNTASIDINYTGAEIRTESCSAEFTMEAENLQDENKLNEIIEKVVAKYYK